MKKHTFKIGDRVKMKFTRNNEDFNNDSSYGRYNKNEIGEIEGIGEFSPPWGKNVFKICFPKQADFWLAPESEFKLYNQQPRDKHRRFKSKENKRIKEVVEFLNRKMTGITTVSDTDELKKKREEWENLVKNKRKPEKWVTMTEEMDIPDELLLKNLKTTYTKEEVREMLNKAYDAGVDEGIEEKSRHYQKDELFKNLLK